MTETFVGQIITDGRITIPDKVRQILGLKEGHFVRVVIEKADNPRKKGANP